MNTAGVTGADGQTAPSTPPTPTLGQLKEALRVLEQTQHLFNSMKAKVVYACGEGQLMASDEGRQYLARVIKSMDDEHRLIRANWPRLAAALEVARTISKVAAARAEAWGRSASGAVGSGTAAEPAAATAAAALQGHCRTVVQQLESVLCEELLARGGTQIGRPAKRSRTGDTMQPPVAAAVSPPPAASPPAPSGTALTASPPAPAPPAAVSLPALDGSRLPPSGPQELLGVLLRIRALGGFKTTSTQVTHGSGGSADAAAVASFATMRLHALDDGGNPLHLPSALMAACAAGAGQAGTGGASGGSAPVPGLVPSLDGSLVTHGSARLASATQVRLLLPGVFVVNVLLEGPGSATPLRVAVDSADKAFELDPWATPTTQVFRRLSALATRVLAYYLKRAPLTVAPRTGAAAGAGGGSAGSAAPSAHSPPPAPAPGPPASQPSAGPNPVVLSEPGHPGAAALEELLLWLLTCRDLFSKRCAAIGKLMAWDPSVQYPVPPIFRVFKLPREELRLRAVDLARVVSYHMHVAPVDQLGWAEDVPAEAIANLAQREGGAAGGPGPAGADAVAQAPAAFQVPAPLVKGPGGGAGLGPGIR